MKKILFISLMLIAVGTLNAQIEEVNADHFSQKKEKPTDTSSVLDKLSKDSRSYGSLFNERLIFNLIGQQLYCVKDKEKDGFERSLIALTLSKDSVIGIKRLQKGTYYNVTNIICSYDEGITEFLSKLFSNPVYSNDTIHYMNYNRKEKVYTFQFRNKEQAKQTVSQLLGRFVYELEDVNGLKYYIMLERKYGSYHNDFKDVTKFGDYKSIVAQVASIDDFISVDTYNYIKSKYENQDLVGRKYYEPEYGDSIRSEKYVYHVEKVGINEGKIALILKEGPDYNDVETINYEYERISSLYYSSVDFRYDTLCSINGIFLRSEVDSILDLKAMEKQKQEKEKAAREAQKKAEYTKKYGAKYAENILNSEVSVGMTKEMVKLSLGSPDKISTSTNSVGKIEIWKYTRYAEWFGGPYIIVTFINGKVSNVEKYR